jgi:hypothetical protein
MTSQVTTGKQLIFGCGGNHAVDQSQQLVLKIVNCHVTQPHFQSGWQKIAGK